MSDVAIIGMACTFPGAPDLETYWQNICNGVDAITDAPANRLDAIYFDETSTAIDRLYARRGGFIDSYANFNAAAFGIMPIAAAGAEPDQLLALQAATSALEDAGYGSRSFARDRTSVIIGRGNYLGAGMTRLNNHMRVAEQLVVSLRTLVPGLSEGQLEEIKVDFQSRCGASGPDTAIGLVPNLTASRIANRLDLGGAAFTVDAACASSLLAVDHAIQELETGRAEIVLAGGLHVCHDPTFWSVLCQVGAVSHQQQIRPFDRRADGLLIGEGVGMVVLKNRAQAEKDGDRIYAVIKGTGVSSDGRDASIMAPSVQGQLLALERAWKEAGTDPDTIGLIEAHGSATSTGDIAELETLTRYFGPLGRGRERAVLGSVKSMIGHTMPAAGAAGLIKAALSVYHGVLPPSLHCEEPRPEVEASRFRVIDRAEPWQADVRRAGVNAFGFGGANGHVMLEAHSPRPAPRRAQRAQASRSDALVIAADSAAELLQLLDARRSRPEGGSWRVAVFDPTPERLNAARSAIEAGRPRFGRDGIFFSPSGLIGRGGKVAFLFPGIEAVASPPIEELASHFGFALPEVEAEGLEKRGFASYQTSALIKKALDEIGVRPDAVAGHSIGEWAGMLASGIVDPDVAEDFIAGLSLGEMEVPDLVYVASGAGLETANKLLEGLGKSLVSHDNCEHQTILCGPHDEMVTAMERLRAQRILFDELPFRSGFHTPAFKKYLPFHLNHLSRLELRKPQIPLWSATTCAPYPDDAAGIQELFGRHLLEPVRFRELVSRLWDDGVRVFLQVGAGSLHSFVDDSLGGKEHNALSTVVTQRSPLDQLRWAAATLFVEGGSPDLQKLGIGARKSAGPAPMRLELGVPLVKLDGPVASEPASPRPAAATGTPKAAAERVEKVTFSIETYPELLGHCLLQQPDYWPDLEDRGPTVPMTMSIALMREAAEKLLPGKVSIGLEKLIANSWLAVAPPVEVEIKATLAGPDRVAVKIGNYVESTVLMADAFPAPPAPKPRIVHARNVIPMTAEGVYSEHWMFHGPAYYSLASLDAMDGNGMRGTLKRLPAKGSLLDAAGQLVGVWVELNTDTDRICLPVKVGKIEFFAPDPPVGAVAECEVNVHTMGRREVRSDIEITLEGKPYCRMEQWEEWRFDTPGNLFSVIRYPDRNLLAEVHPGGFVIVNAPDRSLSALNFVARRFISVRELDELKALTSGRQTAWLYGRIAAKDAVRAYLFDQGHGPIYPIEVGIDQEASGRPVVKTATGLDLRVSISHTDGLAVAIAAEGHDVGIDVEKIEPRSEQFAALAFTEDELALLPAKGRDEWLTRFWCAKEAVGKYRGTGLAGAPKLLQVKEIAGTRLLVEDQWVQTQRMGTYIIAWTNQ